MSRISEALHRVHADTGQVVGPSIPTPDASPWLLEEHDGPNGSAPATRSAIELATDAPTGQSAPGDVGRPMRTGRFDGHAGERLVVSATATPLFIEQFRSLAASLHHAQREQPVRSVIVTSASPGDGKSHVALNLALTLSDSYRRQVLLIDADLRRPSLHLMLGIPNARGLAEALRSRLDELVTGVEISETLTLLTAGRADPNPLGSLSSNRMKRVVEDASSRFDWVIVDAPPVGLLADGRLISENVDGAILVVRAGVTRFQDVEAAADSIGRDRILGIVLNGVDPAEIRGKNYYHHYYGAEAHRS